MVKVYYNGDIKENVLAGKKVAIIGYGSQGHAHALNLKESGIDVIVGVRQGKSFTQAQEDGHKVFSVREAAAQADIIMVLLPDEQQQKVYESEIKDELTAGKSLVLMWMYSLSPLKDLDTLSEEHMNKARAYRHCLPSTRMYQAKRKIRLLLMQKESAERVRAFLKQHLRKKRKRICSVSRLFCAEV